MNNYPHTPQSHARPVAMPSGLLNSPIRKRQAQLSPVPKAITKKTTLPNPSSESFSVKNKTSKSSSSSDEKHGFSLSFFAAGLLLIAVTSSAIQLMGHWKLLFVMELGNKHVDFQLPPTPPANSKPTDSNPVGGDENIKSVSARGDNVQSARTVIKATKNVKAESTKTKSKASKAWDKWELDTIPIASLRGASSSANNKDSDQQEGGAPKEVKKRTRREWNLLQAERRMEKIKRAEKERQAAIAAGHELPPETSPPEKKKRTRREWNKFLADRRRARREAAAAGDEAREVQWSKLTGLHPNACETTLDLNRMTPAAREMMIFTCPKPLAEGEELPQIILDWHKYTQKKGRGQLVVIANDIITREVCREQGIPTICVAHTEENLPRFDLMMRRMDQIGSEAAALSADPKVKSAVVGYVNADVTIKDSGITSLWNFFASLKGKSFDVLIPHELKAPFNTTGETTEDWFAAMTRVDVSADGVESEHKIGGYDLWAWNIRLEGPQSLLPFRIPPFRFPLSVYDNWLFTVVQKTAERAMLDISHVDTLYHQDHDRPGGGWAKRFMSGSSGIVLNRYLGYTEPSNKITLTTPEMEEDYSHIRYLCNTGTTPEAPYIAKKEGKGKFTFEMRDTWDPPHEDLPWERALAVSDRKRLIAWEVVRAVITGKIHKKDKWAFKFESNAAKKVAAKLAENWRYTMEQQLKIHATENKEVLVTAVTYEYRRHLMNFKCNLERVGMIDNFVVAALDQDMFEWGVMEGLPVFLVEEVVANEGETETGYGGQGFKSVTKLKSRIVYRILEAGYTAIWSDVDITWFESPFKALAPYLDPSFKGIAIQSNAPYVYNKDALALPHPSVKPVKDSPPAWRLNSGLYVAKHDRVVVRAFKEIITHAAASSVSEQPSFDHVLCKREPSIRHDDWCDLRVANITRGVKVATLDLFQFPNGAVLMGPENKNVFDLGKEGFEQYSGKGSSCAHNNWIVGHTAKQERQDNSGWWFLEDAEDPELLSCRFHGDGGFMLSQHNDITSRQSRKARK